MSFLDGIVIDGTCALCRAEPVHVRRYVRTGEDFCQECWAAVVTDPIRERFDRGRGKNTRSGYESDLSMTTRRDR